MVLPKNSSSESRKRAPVEGGKSQAATLEQSSLVRSTYNSLKGTFQKHADRASGRFSKLGIVSKLRVRNPSLFPQFAKLPQELQIKIWEFAILLPRLIKLESTGDMIQNRAYYRVINTNGTYPLLLTSFLSRQTALKGTGNFYSIGYYKPWDSFTLQPAYSIHFDSERDTICVPNLSTLINFASWYNICPHNQLNTRARVTAVKSLAIGGVVLPAKTPKIPNIDLGALRWTGAGPSFFISILRYTGLEELIFIEPTMEGGMFHNRSAAAEAKYKQEVQKSLTYMAWVLKANIQDSVSRNEGVDRRTFGSLVPIVLSDWWANPKITAMSKEEVRARFGQAKLVGSGSSTFKEIRRSRSKRDLSG